MVKNPPADAGDMGQGGPLEKEMTTHSRSLAWEIPWTEEPGGLWSMGHKELDTTVQLSACMHTHTHVLE